MRLTATGGVLDEDLDGLGEGRWFWRGGSRHGEVEDEVIGVGCC